LPPNLPAGRQGGEVFEWYEDGRLKRWLCGLSPKGEPICPMDMQKDAIIYLNNEGKYEGTNPGQETLDVSAACPNFSFDPSSGRG